MGSSKHLPHFASEADKVRQSKHKFQLRAVDLSLEDYPSVTLGATGHCTPRKGKAHTAMMPEKIKLTCDGYVSARFYSIEFFARSAMFNFSYAARRALGKYKCNVNNGYF